MVGGPPDDADSVDERLGEIIADYVRAVESGTPPDRHKLLAEHPELADELREFFRHRDRVESLVDPLRNAVQHALNVRCPHCHNAIELLDDALHAFDRDSGQLDFLTARMLTATASEFSVVAEMLQTSRDRLIDVFWRVAVDSGAEPVRRFRACCALAAFDPSDERWEEVATFVADQLVSAPLSDLATWRAELHPARSQLTSPLQEIFRSEDQFDQKRLFAAYSLADYLAGDSAELFQLLMASTAQQFQVILPSLAEHRAEVVRLLQAEVEQPQDAAAGIDEQARLAERQFRAAIALYRFQLVDAASPVLRQSPLPQARTRFIHRAAEYGVDPREVLGNAQEWCHGTWQRYPWDNLDRQLRIDLEGRSRKHAIRGGRIRSSASAVVSSYRLSGVDSGATGRSQGFRPARTIVPSHYDLAPEFWEEAVTLGRQGKVREAAQLMDVALPHLLPNASRWCAAINVLNFLGETEKASLYSDEMLRRFGETQDPKTAHSLVVANLQLADRQVTEQIERLVEVSARRGAAGNIRDRGVLHYRRAEYASAVEWLEKANQPDAWRYGRLYTLYYLAMSRQGLGDSDGARSAFDEAEGIRNKLQADMTDDDYGPRWETWLGAEVLRREAEGVVRPEPID